MDNNKTKEDTIISVARILMRSIGSVSKSFTKSLSRKPLVNQNPKTSKRIIKAAPIARKAVVEDEKEETVEQEFNLDKEIDLRIEEATKDVVDSSENLVQEPLIKLNLSETIGKIKFDSASLLRDVPFMNDSQRLQSQVFLTDLNSKSPKVRAGAMREIKKLPTPIAVSILKNALAASDTRPVRRLSLLNALSAMNQDGAVGKDLFKEFLTHADAGQRLTALRALSKYKDSESVDILMNALHDKDGEVRRQALNLLFWNNPDACVASASTMLYDMDNRVRKTAISICGALKLRQCISPLITLLNDPEPSIQKSASESLKKITNQNIAFRVSANEKTKQKAIEAWSFWWRDNQATFGFKINN
ncbi:MAG: hypothetical protein ACI9CF_001337 [Candidatus Omnitrophota bacterium]|jgi:hypothetical protein